MIFREIAKEAGCKRLADVDSPFICMTGHPIDENSAYIFAINYNNKKSEGNITFAEDFKITSVWGNAPENGKIAIDANDGVLFKVEKK